MHELQVTPLLMHKGSSSSGKSRQRSHQRLKRGSQSFDDCGGEEFSSRHQYKPTRAYRRQRSNPNILDLIPPPPPLYAPSSDTPYYDGDIALEIPKKSSSKSHRSSAFKSKHINERRDSDTSEYFTQVRMLLMQNYTYVLYTKIFM